MNLPVTPEIQSLQIELSEIMDRRLEWEKKQKPNLSLDYLHRKKRKVFAVENKRMGEIVDKVAKLRLMGLSKQ